MLIRSELSSDIDAIFVVHKLSFSTTVEAELVSRLREAQQLLVSLVAEVNQSVVGHIAFSPVTTVWGHRGTALGPIAVWDIYRRQGIATQLVEAGLATCKSAGLGWAVVRGDPGFYGRFGFRPAEHWGLADEYRGNDAFQAIELISGALPVNARLVRYAEPFRSFK